MTPRRTFALIVALLLALLSATAAELNVFAAASLADALKELARNYEASSGDKLRFNLGASSTLARQIKEGAPADVFFSADEAKMDDLAAAGLIAADSRRSLLSNTLVIVVGNEGGPTIAAAADLASASVRRIALGETQTVPAGIYAREYLQQLGLWTQLSGKVVPVDNVRAALAAVESGNADAGIVYKTDALISKKVKVAFEVPLAEGPKISYPVAVLRKATNSDAATKFVIYLASPEAVAMFTRFGFLPSR